MTPLLAALSIAEIAARICSAVRSGAKRICFCSLRRCVLTLRLWAARLSVCRARLPADFVLAIGDQEFIERTPLRFYKRLFAASFAFCRAPARAPAVRICSKLSELEGGIASMVSTYLRWRLRRHVCSLRGSYLRWRLRRYLCNFRGSYLRWRLRYPLQPSWQLSAMRLRRYLCEFVELSAAGGVMFAATTPPLIS